jgi:threonine synthase
MNLLDNLKSADLKIIKEVRSLSERGRGSSLSLVDRIECFEDIIRLEIGDTSLNRAKNREDDFNIRQLSITHKGENPSSTGLDQ